MRLRDAIDLLRSWFERLRVAVWLHPEFDGGRRAVLFGAASLVAASVLAQVPGYRTAAQLSPGVDWVEMNVVVRRAFMPRMQVSSWISPPWMQASWTDA